MGKIVMPKNSALLDEIESVLKIYYEAQTWLSNDVYKTKLKAMIGADQYSSSYTKKAQITSYFGFTIWEDKQDSQSRRKITESGKRMYEAIRENNKSQIQEELMEALETVKFGRDNCGCPESNSDVEPPSLFVRAVLDLGYLTYREFAYLLWKLEDLGGNYTDSLSEIRIFRNSGTIELGEEANKYADCKPIMILIRWGFLSEDGREGGAGKQITILPEVLAKYRTRLRNLKVYNIDMDCDEIRIIDHDTRENTNLAPVEKTRLTTGSNILLYGVPGSGKSWAIEHEYCHPSSLVERLVFHPDYSYSDFVGQILPKIKESEDNSRTVSYEFTPGPFTNILQKAYLNPTVECILIIEEINRGNAPAIFGEVFQLLDRKINHLQGNDDPVGTSEYGITNENIAQVVYGDRTHKVKIPSNLSIIATMNTSDQNVFTLDTAFQRRWQMRLIENSFDTVSNTLAKAEILDTGVSWEKFCTVVNKIIVANKAEMASSEDKRLGVYFVHIEDLVFDPNGGNEYEYQNLKGRTQSLSTEEKQKLLCFIEARKQNRKFPEKVIKYLWDDAFRFNPEELFAVDKFNNLESVIRAFLLSDKKNRFEIFKESVRSDLFSTNQGE